MLIDSPRLTARDRDVWRILSASDARRGRTLRIGRLESSALRVVERFLRDPSDCYVSMSWGKDSVSVAHLVRQVEPTVPLVHGAWRKPGPVRCDASGVAYSERSGPESDAVRDAFLSVWPMPYDEVECSGASPWHAPIKSAHGARRIMGIRAAESGTRAMSARMSGQITLNTCRPILHWTTDDVFAYLARHDLPVHAAYAMSMGGQREREHLRVDVLGGPEGVNFGRRAWELRYFRDVLPIALGGMQAPDASEVSQAR